MRSLLLTLVLLAALPAHTKDAKTDSDAAISQQLQAMEQAWIDAEKKSDPAAFEKLAADDWIGISPEGKTQTRAQAAADIKSGHVDSVTLGPMKVRVFGSTAVVTGTDDTITTENGKQSTARYVWTDVFVKRNGKWLAVASQAAQVK